MSGINDYKITDTQGNKVSDVPGSTLSGTVAQNKAVFDKLGEFIITKYNGMIDYIRGKGIDTGVSGIIDAVYPVGAIYMSTSSTNPQTLFGGTWQQITGKFLLASSSSYAAGSTGGSADAIVVSHTHTFTGSSASAGAHTHTVSGSAASGGASGTVTSSKAGGHTHTMTVAEAGAHTHTATVTINANGTHHHTIDTYGYPGSDTVTFQSVAFANCKGNYHSPTTVDAGAHTHTASATIASNGAHNHTVTASTVDGHTHTVSIGAHTHTISGTAASAGAHTHTITGTNASTGSSGTGMNMPPYLAVYVWKRTA